MSLIRQLNSLFSKRQWWQLAILGLVLVVRAVVEMVGVASIMPFISVVADPGVVSTNPYFSRVYDAFGFGSVTTFITALGVCMLVFLVLANGVSALAVYGMTRFSWGIHHRLSIRLLEGYLRQPYSFFVQRNSAAFSKTLLNECQEVVRGVLEPMLNAGAKVLLMVALVCMLVVLDPVLATVIVAVFGGSYAILYNAVKARQRRFGQERVSANQQRFKVAAEAFGGIKDVKVLQREKSFVDQYVPASRRYSRTNASNTMIAKLPRYLFEMVAFGSIVLIVLYYIQAGQGIARILPMLSLYAFAGYRIMPELQQLFHAVVQIRFNRAALDDLSAALASIVTPPAAKPAGESLPFEQMIEVDHVTFTYPGQARPALDDISLRVERNQTIGLVGASGSGKTTLVDLIIGLYEPDRGRILVDGVPLNANTLSAWRRQVGYVPQHIFLTDDTIAANVAFGEPPGEVDIERVQKAARIAHLHDFILSLPDGYLTFVGERGVRLSGGQRQRIGIARALYHEPAILVMDEATSALDGTTEHAVMEAIHALAGEKTIILIAHRLTTVQDADVIWMIADGRVTQSGRYEFLLGATQPIRALAGAAT